MAAFEAMTARRIGDDRRRATRAGRVAVAEGWEEARIRLAAVRGGQAKRPRLPRLVDFLAAESDGTLAAAGDDERREAVRQLDDLTLLPGDTLLENFRLSLQLRLDTALDMREAFVRHAAEILPLCDATDARRWSGEATTILDDPTALTEQEIQSLMVAVDVASPLWPAVARRRAETALAAGDLVTVASVLDRVDAIRPGQAWLRCASRRRTWRTWTPV